MSVEIRDDNNTENEQEQPIRQDGKGRPSFDIVY